MSAILKDMVKVTYEDQSSRKILNFLLLTISFMFVEMVYGYLSNSLSLISDGFHMLCDSLALLVGLLVSYIGKRQQINVKEDQKTKQPFGLMKIESLAGLFNGLFLISVSCNLFIKSYERIQMFYTD